MIIQNGKTVIRYDTLDNWNKFNPILEKSELIAVTNNKEIKLKVGDGVSKFNVLPFISL